LPDAKIELVPINTYSDKLTSFQKTADLMNDEKIVAILGDDTDESTLSMANLAAVNKVFHCAVDSKAPGLSQKSTYPLTYRTQQISKCKFFVLSSPNTTFTFFI
jgi:ABC-type branched-subunit amino acid transport system substrate-binding protein